MINQCATCGDTFDTKYRGWWHVHLPPVCSAQCFKTWVLDQPALSFVGNDFKKLSDRSCRSEGERRLIKALDKLDLPWQYEPLWYQLKDKSRYVPDFLVAGRVLIEFKGIWNTEAKKKFKMLHAQLSEYDEVIVAVDAAFVGMLGRK